MFECQGNLDPLRELEKQRKTMIEMAPNCPRCASPNTKFCYYNNYSLTQPRYFCKGCRRYWTKGGSLRNVPIGGGCRKSRRSKSAKPRSPHTIHSRDSNDLSQISNNCDSASKAGSDIDLAAVFANFLSQTPAGVEAQPDRGVHEIIASEPDLVQGSIPCMAEKITEEAIIIGNEIGELGSQKLLGDDREEEISTAELSWQQMAHLDLHGFGPLSMNLVNDNIWSSFDFSGFEIFSRS